jgi:hypothetical protein
VEIKVSDLFFFHTPFILRQGVYVLRHTTTLEIQNVL